jgi:hypothetical protein
MYRYKRLLVGVSFASQDGSSIRYAAMISRLAKSEKITFVLPVLPGAATRSMATPGPEEERPELASCSGA